VTSQNRAAANFPRPSKSVLIKKIAKCDPGVAAECTTVFEPNDPVFDGHFVGDPLVPGVVLTEALAETARIAAASEHPPERQPVFSLSAIRQMKFFAPVRPAEEITLQAQRLGETGDSLQFQVAATVAGKEVAAGQLMFGVAKGM
jgi:3-hydroxyacyl-[acyl-carrier-protein] dehydratase